MFLHSDSLRPSNKCAPLWKLPKLNRNGKWFLALFISFGEQDWTPPHEKRKAQCSKSCSVSRWHFLKQLWAKTSPYFATVCLNYNWILCRYNLRKTWPVPREMVVHDQWLDLPSANVDSYIVFQTVVLWVKSNKNLHLVASGSEPAKEVRNVFNLSGWCYF